MKTQHSKQWTNLSTTGTRIFHAGLNKSNLGKVRFFLGGGGRAGEFWYFFPKKVLALPCVLIKKTPDPPPLGDRQKRHPPLTTTWYVPCCTNLRIFACERKVLEYEHISILNVCVLKQGKCEQSVWDIYVL